MAYDGYAYGKPEVDVQLRQMYDNGSMPSHSGPDEHYFQPLPSDPSNAEVAKLHHEDSRIKKHLRILRLVSRIIALVLSGATMSLVSMTLYKYLTTKNQMVTVNGQQRTAWAADTKTIYTYVYFGVSAVSFFFDFAIVIAYCRGVKAANSTANVAGWWSKLIIVVHVILWVGSAAIYKIGSLPINGQYKDLWGWTCSSAADQIQAQVKNVNYAMMCMVQTDAWFFGIGNVVSGVVTAIIYFMMLARMRSKKKLMKQAGYQANPAKEPLRHHP